MHKEKKRGRREEGTTRDHTVSGNRPRGAAAARVENFGCKRDFRSLTRWQWSVMVTGERLTGRFIYVRRIVRSFTRYYLDGYVRTRSTRARNISSPDLSRENRRRVTRKICLVYEESRARERAMHRRTCTCYGMRSKFRAIVLSMRDVNPGWFLHFLLLLVA